MIIIQDDRDNYEVDKFNILTELLTDKFDNIKLNTYHKRIFVA